ncbi:Thioredoxin domain-containing protein 3 [Grifola frondosa]|uniref:Nucleoside diphosphate kinase n=1 Tax=Grifola frondosa TaxID=5627 RepID=A0A1C7M2Q3_GRIFR|nr:Thioredoxin domain-containing protein 3 [Grifola frondosa]
MSAPSLPSSPLSETPGEARTSPLPSRTVAIIKNHALNNRFDIELRISEAGFEIVKERQMEFDVETDPDTLYDLFGEDYESFAEGPVWVYVLERRRAVEVWHSLMGAADPEVARQDTPHSLRALYGISLAQNAVMGSPDAQSAEVQIEAIFASSPPFPTTELPDVGYDDVTAGSLRSVSSSIMAALRNSHSDGTSTSGTQVNGKPSFKARPLPVTHAAPDIVPRMSRAAALRAGMTVETPKRAPPTKERLAQTFANRRDHYRRFYCTPCRGTAYDSRSVLRLGQKPPEVTRRSSIAGGLTEAAKATFEGVPGHKRRESIAVASTKPPAVAPRTNKSASLRQQKDTAPPSSFMFRKPVPQPTLSRSSSRQSLDNPGTTRPIITRPVSAASVQPNGTTRPALSRTTSLSNCPRPSVAPRTSTNGAVSRAAPRESTAETPAKPKPRLSVPPPTIQPRTNKSALLRAAKMAGAAITTPAKSKSAPVAKAVKV